MSLDELDPILTPPKRLACMGVIAAGRKVEFAALRDLLDLSDSDLSKQLKVLADSGYIESHRTGKAATRRTWLSITKAGRRALATHAEALQKLVDPVAVPTHEAKPSSTPTNSRTSPTE